jgi:hypothetical protein
MPKTDPSALTIHRPDPAATRKMYVAISVSQGKLTGKLQNFHTGKQGCQIGVTSQKDVGTQDRKPNEKDWRAFNGV